jgi:acyl-CoA synthetase (AMP-forming)/AMP-acid ligase II
MFLEELAAQEAAPRRIDSLETGLMAGSPALVREVHEQLGISGICTGYGMSETSASAATTAPDDPLEVRMTTVGRPLEGCEIRIADPDSGEWLETGLRGEICMRGANVFDHYDNEPEGTAAVFDEGGWFHSGDEGSLDGEGRLRFHGRLKDIIRVGGENISPLEVETLIAAHPAVKLAQVIGVADERLQEVPVAFVEAASGAAIDEAELLAWCRGRLASFKLPRRVIVVPEWPMTGSGRIQRHELRRIWVELESVRA